MSLASKYVGIINQGSTCYLNSVIQTLYHLPAFRRKVFEIKPKEPNPVLSALRNLFAELAAGHRNITTTELTDAFGWDAREAAIQHDVHELIQQLFDTLETIMKGTPDEAFIRHLFGGQLIYRSKATDGVRYVSDRLESFYDIELVVEKKNSIEESLKALTTPERIEGVSIEVTPGAAPTKHNIERSLGLLQLPPVLLVHPNRVGFDMETFEPITLSNRWSFTAELNLAPYMVSGNELRLDKESTEKMAKMAETAAPPLRVGFQYELRTVLVHAGDANIGHYYIYVRFPQDQWVCFNDDLVEAATAENVAQAAFGGQPDRGYGGRYRPFGSERASLLVYVNTACEESILAEPATPEAILTLATKIEQERNERWNTSKVSFLVCDEAYVDVLDGVPGAAERLEKSVKVASSASEEELQAAIGRSLSLTPGESVVLGPTSFQAGLLHRCLLVEIIADKVREERKRAQQAGVSGDDENASPLQLASQFGFLRICQRPDAIGKPMMFHTNAELRRLIPSDGNLFVYSASSQTMSPVNLNNRIEWGKNFIFVKKGVNPDSVLHSLLKRQVTPTEVYFVDRMSRMATQRMFSLTVFERTPYTTLQGGVYDVCRQHPELFKSLPPSSKHIGFYCYDSNIKRPDELLAPMVVRSRVDGSRREVSQEMLCGRGKERRLYATFLPIPMSEVNYQVAVIFRLGWAEMPMVYFTWDPPQISFGQLLQVAFQQLGDSIPEMLRQRYARAQMNTSGTPEVVARLLEVRDGFLMSSTKDATTRVNMGKCDSTFVIDPLPMQMPNFTLIDVSFCSRRRGEDYFGYPTCVLVSNSAQETGHTIVLRVTKKLNVPGAESVVSKWMLYVKKMESKSIKLCEPKDELATVLKALGGGPFEFLIDRVAVPELDGLKALDARQEENNGIVIKSSSTTDLSAL